MSQQGGQQQGGDDQEILKLTIYFFLTGLIIWLVLQRYIHVWNAFVGAVTWLHIYPMAMVVNYVPIVLEIPFIGDWLFRMSAMAHDFLIEGGYAHMSPESRSAVLTASGRCAVLYYGPVFLWIALKGQDFRVDKKYRMLHNLESMIAIQSEIWPTSRIARHIDPLKLKEIDAKRIADEFQKKLTSTVDTPGALPRINISIRPGSWNRSIRPEEWLLANGLSFSKEEYKIISDPELMTKTSQYQFRSEWEKVTIETVSEVLAEQLRNRWTGPKALRPCLKAIYAVMALFYDYKINDANRLLNELGIVAGAIQGKAGAMDAAILAEKGLMARIDDICNGQSGRRLGAIGARHAYVESAFPVMMANARKDRGVLPPAAFLWLKNQDRLMWYILNSVGNDAIMVEAAGSMAHSKAETQIGKPIMRPAVYQAARAMIEDYMDMTEERIEVRREKEIRSRAPGTQVDLLADSILAKYRTEQGTDGNGAQG